MAQPQPDALASASLNSNSDDTALLETAAVRVLDANLCCIFKSETASDARLHSSARVPRFMELLRRLAPDIVMMQELRACFYARSTDGAFEFQVPGNLGPVLDGLYRIGYDAAVPCLQGTMLFYNAVCYKRDEWQPIADPRVVYYEFCRNDERRWYAYVVALRSLRTGARIGIVNTHFPLKVEHRLASAAELNALARAVADDRELKLDAVIAGGDTNIFADDRGDEQEALLSHGAVYLTKELWVDPAREIALLGFGDGGTTAGDVTADQADGPIGTFVGYEYDAVRPTSDRCRGKEDAADRAGKLDGLFLFAPAGRTQRANVLPITLPWRFPCPGGKHMSSMTWVARNYPRHDDVAPPISDHIPLLVELTIHRPSC